MSPRPPSNRCRSALGGLGRTLGRLACRLAALGLGGSGSSGRLARCPRDGRPFAPRGSWGPCPLSAACRPASSATRPVRCAPWRAAPQANKQHHEANGAPHGNTRRAGGCQNCASATRPTGWDFRARHPPRMNPSSGVCHSPSAIYQRTEWRPPVEACLRLRTFTAGDFHPNPITADGDRVAAHGTALATKCQRFTACPRWSASAVAPDHGAHTIPFSKRSDRLLRRSCNGKTRKWRRQRRQPAWMGAGNARDPRREPSRERG